jgi:hypothetical protein
MPVNSAVLRILAQSHITEEVTFEDGHPTLASIYQVSRTIISERWQKLKGEGE